jgi:hypothetical protein
MLIYKNVPAAHKEEEVETAVMLLRDEEVCDLYRQLSLG